MGLSQTEMDTGRRAITEAVIQKLSGRAALGAALNCCRIEAVDGMHFFYLVPVDNHWLCVLETVSGKKSSFEIQGTVAFDGYREREGARIEAAQSLVKKAESYGGLKDSNMVY